MFTKKLSRMFLTSLVLVGSLVGVAAAKPARLDDDGGDRAAMKQKHAEKKQEKLLKYDFNKNGALDDNEKAALHAERAATMFDKLDANHDGVISKAEFIAGKQARGFGGHHRGRGKGHEGPRGHRGGMKGM